MRTIVLVKHVPDTELPRHLDTATGAIDMSGDNVLDEINSRALTWALEVRNAAGGEVIAVTMGPKAATESLRAALAIGANEAVHIIDDAQPGPDAIASSAVLAAAIKQIGFDLVVAGDASTDGSTGAVPAMLAERLGVPHLTYVTAASVAGQTITATRDGGDVSYELTADLPAVVSVTEKIAEPKVPGFKGIMTAKRKPRRTLQLSDLGLDASSLAGGGWTITSVRPKPPRGKGHTITDDGTAAQQITDYLANLQIIGK